MVKSPQKYPFAALRFAEDGNISDRVYWYLCPFSVKEGDSVLAPVGSRDRLQLARAEKILYATAAESPYDMRLIKSVAAKYGARKLTLSGGFCIELGGVRYDGKRFTRYGIFLCCRSGKFTAEDIHTLSDYGVGAVLDFRPNGVNEVLPRGLSVFRFPVPDSDCSAVDIRNLTAALEIAAKERGCVLFYGQAGSAVSTLLLQLAGCAEGEIRSVFPRGGFAEGAALFTEEALAGGVESYLVKNGISPDTVRALQKKLR